jgi:hypothetical protein
MASSSNHKESRLPATTVAITSVDAANGRVNLTVTGAAPALFVVVTTAQLGQFDENGFHLLVNETRTVVFTAWDEESGVDPSLFTRSLHVHWLNDRAPRSNPGIDFSPS